MAVQPVSAEPLKQAVAGFDWDSGNREKCQKHGVSAAAIESAFHRPLAVFPDPAHSDAEDRLKAIGRTDEGRAVLIVFTLRTLGGATFIRPVSARYMHRKEVDHYDKAAAAAEKRH
jgi:uncharacterized DUF497 family protein